MDNYIVTANLSFNNDVKAVENIDGNRFAVGGEFTQVTDSTGEVKDCSYCGIFNKEGELVLNFDVGVEEGYGINSMAYLGNNKLAIGGVFSTVSGIDTSHCAIVDVNDRTVDVSFGMERDFTESEVFSLAYLGNNKEDKFNKNPSESIIEVKAEEIK